jgi:hypothetical protein
MDGVREFLEQLRRHHLTAGNLRGILHIAIGRRISRPDGTVLSTGTTWRQLSELLRTMRWDKEAVREIGLDPDDLPPRDRQRFWYTVIAAAKVDSAEAVEAANAIAEQTENLGYIIGPAPGRS